jgi:hypothetical protein
VVACSPVTLSAARLLSVPDCVYLAHYLRDKKTQGLLQRGALRARVGSLLLRMFPVGHLAARIPNYHLRAAFKSNPVLQHALKLTLRTSKKHPDRKEFKCPAAGRATYRDGSRKRCDPPA